MTTTPWNQARRLLCVRLGGLADVLMCTPAMRALRAQHPARRLTLLASPAGAALAPYLDDVDEVIAYQAPWAAGAAVQPERQRGQQGVQACGQECSPECGVQCAPIAALAAHRFDAAVIFTSYRQSALPAALLCQLAGIPLRLAYCCENPYQLLSDWIADPEPGAMRRHEVQRQLDLVRRIDAEIADERLAFTPAAADIDAVRTRLRGLGIDPDRRWLVLHPGAGALSRPYPPHYWQTLVRALGERVRCPLVFTGAAHEAALAAQIAAGAGIPVHSFAGQLHIGELGALLAQASLVVSNNTGPAHLAAAVGTPVVGLYALTGPRHTPWRVPSRVLDHDVDCRNCERSVCPQGHSDCPEKRAPVRVVDAICSLLKQAEPYRRRENRMA